MTTRELIAKLDDQIRQLSELTIPGLAERILVEHLEDERTQLVLQLQQEESH